MPPIRLVLVVLVPVLLLAPLLGPAQAKDAKGVTILLKCDEATVPAVVKALQGLDVELYDVDTMQPLHGAEAKPAPQPRAPKPPPALLDATVLLNHALEALETLRNQSGQVPYHLDRIEVKQTKITALLHVSDLKVLDALRDALAKSPGVSSWAEEQSPIRLGDARPLSDAQWKTSFQVALKRPPADAEIPAGTLKALEWKGVEKAAAAAGARLVYASRERETRHGVVVTRSQSFEFEIPELATTRQLLPGLAKETGAIVTEVSYAQRARKGSDPVKRTLRVVLSRRTYALD